MKTFTFNDKYDFFTSSNSSLEETKKSVVESIIERLSKNGVQFNKYAIGIPDAGDDGLLCIHEENDFWVVYTAERGRRFGQAVFTSASDAANYYVWMLSY